MYISFWHCHHCYWHRPGDPITIAIVKQSVRGPAPLVRTSLSNQFVLYFTFNMRVLDIYRTMRIQFPEFFCPCSFPVLPPYGIFSQSFYLIEILHKNFVYFFILGEWQKRWKMHQNWALMTFKLFGYFALMASATSVRKRKECLTQKKFNLYFNWIFRISIIVKLNVCKKCHIFNCNNGKNSFLLMKLCIRWS